MARTTRSVGGQIAIAGLLTAAIACATVQDPPGGPPDFEPPVLLLVTPDSGAVVDGFDDELEFEFDEVINEPNVSQLIEVSPRHDEVRVSWRRRRLTVRPRDGWRDSIPYRVTLLPGATDLRNNRTDSGRVVVFSTGGPIPDTRVTGRVVDWEGGRMAPGALIELIRAGDSLTFIGTADSAGGFEVQAVPPGRYALVATLDQNTNSRRERREAFDSLNIVVDSVTADDLWAFVHDTVGPRLSEVTALDSITIGTTFTQSLDSVRPTPAEFRVRLLPDSVLVPVDSVFWRRTYDSLARLQPPPAADSAAVDSLAAAGDTAAPRVALPVLQPDTSADSTDASAALLAERPRLSTQVVLRFASPLTPGARYLVEATVRNLLQAIATSAIPVDIPAAPPDSS